MDTVWLLIMALYKGRELQNKEIWKNSSALLSIFTAAIKAVDTFIPGIDIGDYQLNTIANGLVQLALLYGSYTTVATSKTVGITE